MAIIFDPSVPMGVANPWQRHERAMATRVRMVLETRPGQIPWRPEFGCDLQSLVGEAAGPQLLNLARWRVEAALKRWIPDVTIDQVNVTVVVASHMNALVASRDVPTAEAALLTVGVQAALHVDVELTGAHGPMAVSATVQP
jgi:phage baseplate assembly protein W